MFFSLTNIFSGMFAYATMALIFGILIALCFSGYILSAIAFYTMAKNKGIDHAWFAWIPFLDMYLMGEIINDKVALGNWVIPNAKWFLTFFPIVCGVLRRIPYIGWIFSVLMLIYSFAAMYRLFKLYDSKNAIVYLIFSILFFWILFLSPLFILIISKKEPQEYLNSEQ